VRQFVEEYLTE
jgi:hypothetical protein